MFGLGGKTAQPAKKPAGTIRFDDARPSPAPRKGSFNELSFNAFSSGITSALADLTEVVVKSPKAAAAAQPPTSPDGFFDNGVDPDQRLSVDSHFKGAEMPPPPPLLSWVDENFPAVSWKKDVNKELEERIRVFFARYDEDKLEYLPRIVAWTHAHSETSLNAKLVQWYKVGLPLPKKDRKNSLVESNISPSTLREQIKTFLELNDRALLNERGDLIVDSMVRMAAAQGLDALNSYLERKYGKNLSSVSDDAPTSSKNAAQVAPAFVELTIDDLVNQQDKIHEDLSLFYGKHDPSKLVEDRLGPIVQWAMRIGRAELDKKFKEKYGESLTEMERSTLQQMHDNQGSFVVTGAPPVSMPTVKEVSEPSSVVAQGCNDYREAEPYQSFGVCVCGLSRSDHHHQPSVLVAGSGKPIELIGLNRKKTSSTSTSSSVASHHPPAPAVVAAPVAQPAPMIAKSPPATVAKLAPVSPLPVAPKPTPVVKAPPALTAPLSPGSMASVIEKRVLANKAAPVSRPAAQLTEAGKDGPCSNYTLDLTGASFGVCKCGWSRADHNAVKTGLSKTLEKKFAKAAVATQG